MKKSAVLISILILSLVFMLPLVLAAENDTEITDETQVEAAYSCLKTQLGTNCGDSDSVEQLSFSLLAMAYDETLQGNCKGALTAERDANEVYWGDRDVKATAQAIIALDYIGEDVADAVEWLISRGQVTEDLRWFLQIDSDNKTNCEIGVNEGTAKDFTVNENKKVSGSSSCLSPSASEQNYYYQIDVDCLEDEFTISCDENFITSIFYKKPGSPVYYISSETHSASSDGETKEKIDSYCFAKTSGSDCDYEASLWATLALASLGEDIAPYLPYISSESDELENKRYFPSAFLYILTDDDEYYTTLTNKQKSAGYWEERARYYDTALALSALSKVSSDEKDDAIEYLFDNQDNSGCWSSNNILETSFLLFASWPKDPFISGGGTSRSSCESFEYSCVSSSLCTTSDTKSNFYCPSLGDVCCEKEPDIESCLDKAGTVCESDQRCTASEVLASDTNYCCLGDCELDITVNACESAGNTCKSACSDDEDEKTVYSGDCSFGEICCADKPQEDGANWLLIILLIILIILVILAIIFRDQLKVWFFKVKSKFKSGKGPKWGGRHPLPPPGMIPTSGPVLRPRHAAPRTPIRRMPARRMPQRRPIPKRSGDSAFDDTMKKLRDMTK